MSVKKLQKTGVFTIKPASFEQMPIAAEFVRSSADWYEKIVDQKDLGQHYVDEKWMDENFKKRDFYLGYLDDEPVGTLSLQYFGDYMYLGYLYLDCKLVGMGLGQKFMQFARDMAIQKGKKGMALIAHPEAVWATKAYLKFGFELVYVKKEEVLSWQNGILNEYYEEDFGLYLYKLEV